jgi:hypothetical protein
VKDFVALILLLGTLCTACSSKSEEQAQPKPKISAQLCEVKEGKYFTTVSADYVLSDLHGLAAVDVAVNVYENGGDGNLILTKTIHQITAQDPQPFHVSFTGQDQVGKVSAEPFDPRCTGQIGQVYKKT